MKRLLVGVVAALLLLAAPALGQGTNGPNIGKGRFVSHLVRDHGQAAIYVRYNCAEGTHVWVSAKQTANGKRDSALKKEGSSAVAATWYQSHREYYRCDGKTHGNWFYIDKLEPGSKGKLRKGQAWIQFCVTSGETEADTKLIVVHVGWVKVI